MSKNFTFDKSLFNKSKKASEPNKETKNTDELINNLKNIFSNDDNTYLDIQFILKNKNNIYKELVELKSKLKKEVINIVKDEYFSEDITFLKTEKKKLNDTKYFKNLFKEKLYEVLSTESSKIIKEVSSKLYKDLPIYPITMHKTCFTCTFSLFDQNAEIGYCKLATLDKLKKTKVPFKKSSISKYPLYVKQNWVPIIKYSSCSKYQVSIKHYFGLLERLLKPTKDL